jgi:chorismate synthase
VAAGHVAKAILRRAGIEVFAYIKEIAGAKCPEVPHEQVLDYTRRYRQMRSDLDPFYQEVYVKGRVTMEMRFLEKMRVFAEIESEIDAIRAKAPQTSAEEVLGKYGVHHILNCPDLAAARAMLEACNRVTKTGDSSGGVVEVVATGLPVGLGEPVFDKLDAQLGRMLGIGAVKGVEVGAGFRVKDSTGSRNNDQMRSDRGKVVFDSNNAGGITGGLTTGQPLCVRLAVKPTPTIAKRQHTIDKYTLKNTELAAITRRDPTIVARIWPVAENFTAIILLDHLMIHYGYQHIQKKIQGK